MRTAAFAPSLAFAPTTGDWTLVGQDGLVTAVLPRRTTVVRGAGRRDARAQVLAANVDVLFVVAALSEAPNLGRIERMLSVAWDSGAAPVILLTKADLSHDPAAEAAEVGDIARGVDVVVLSVRSDWGLDAVRAILPPGRTGALIGLSGTGKSTLVNALAGSAVLPTGALNDDGKERHTSAARDLVLLPWGAALIDTPGLRGVQLWAAAGVEQAFSDVSELAAQCRFTDCRHDGEPGCAIAVAVAAGTLAPRRLASYDKCKREQSWLAGRYDARLRAEQRRIWKLQSQQVRWRSAR